MCWLAKICFLCKVAMSTRPKNEYANIAMYIGHAEIQVVKWRLKPFQQWHKLSRCNDSFYLFLSFFILVYFILFFSRALRDSTPRFVRRLVGWFVTLYFFYVFYSLTVLLLPKCSGELKYGPRPPARNWVSRVSGLVFQTVSQARIVFCYVIVSQ